MDGYEMTHIAFKSTEELPYCFLRSTVKFRVHTGWKINLDLIWDYKASHSYIIPQICHVQYQINWVYDVDKKNMIYHFPLYIY